MLSRKHCLLVHYLTMPSTKELEESAGAVEPFYVCLSSVNSPSRCVQAGYGISERDIASWRWRGM